MRSPRSRARSAWPRFRRWRARLVVRHAAGAHRHPVPLALRWQQSRRTFTPRGAWTAWRESVVRLLIAENRTAAGACATTPRRSVAPAFQAAGPSLRTAATLRSRVRSAGTVREGSNAGARSAPVPHALGARRARVRPEIESGPRMEGLAKRAALPGAPAPAARTALGEPGRFQARLLVLQPRSLHEVLARRAGITSHLVSTAPVIVWASERSHTTGAPAIRPAAPGWEKTDLRIDRLARRGGLVEYGAAADAPSRFQAVGAVTPVERRLRRKAAAYAAAPTPFDEAPETSLSRPSAALGRAASKAVGELEPRAGGALDPVQVDRLVVDVIRRIGHRARVERERRGL
jgi:hypothetical protein